MRHLPRINFALFAALLLAFALLPAHAAPDYGQIVSQAYDKTQMMTETHLANGLTILSKEVHAAPVVYFSVWYKVGSRNERADRLVPYSGTHDVQGDN